MVHCIGVLLEYIIFYKTESNLNFIFTIDISLEEHQLPAAGRNRGVDPSFLNS